MKKDPYIFAMALVVGLSLFAYSFLFQGESEVSVASDQQASVTFGQLNNYRKEVRKKKTMETQKVSVENYQRAPGVKWRPKQVQKESLNLKSVPSAAAIDMQKSARQFIAEEPSLEKEINQLLAERQKFEQLSQIQRQNYVAGFKKEAYRLGFRIEFNDNLEVIEFERIPKTQREKDFSEQDLVHSQEYY